MANPEPQSQSLREFIQRYATLLNNEPDDGDQWAFLRSAHFALTGRDGVQQYQIDPLRNRLDIEHDLPAFKRDYDSLIGFTRSIPIESDIYILPLSSARDVLTEDLHVKVDFLLNHPNEGTRPMKPHKIPNLGFARVNERTLIRMFFPRLYAVNQNSALTDEQRRAVYEDGIYPSLQELTPENIPNWPPSYETAAWLAKNRSGGVQHGTHPFPSHLTDDLGLLIAEKLMDSHDWAHGLTYMVQVRGVKEAHGHNPSRNMARQELLQLTADLRTDEGSWFVDVGFEISEDRRAYLWRTDAHRRILRHVVGLNANESAIRASPNNWRYARDINAHIVGLSGFRLPLDGRVGGINRVRYIQVYTTDKALTYHLERGMHSKTMTGLMALRGNPPSFVKTLFDAFISAANNMDVAARIEVRVPLHRARNVLLEVDDDFLRHNLVVMPRSTWWYWKSIRAYSAGVVMSTQNTSPGLSRVMIEALQLTAGLVWLVNSLNSRPDDGSAARDLMLSILPTILDHDAGNLMYLPSARNDGPVPYCPDGVIFLKPFVLPPISIIPRLSGGIQPIRAETFKFFFAHDITMVRNMIRRTGIAVRDLTTRIPTRKGHTRVRLNEEAVPVVEGFVGLQVDRPVVGVDVGDDLAPEDIISEDNLDAPTWLSRLWYQFLSDVLQKCGNSHNMSTSHCHLSVDDRRSVTPEIYQSLDLALVFRRVQWRRITRNEMMAMFGAFWPSQDHLCRTDVQNYKTMLYYSTWKLRAGELRAADVNRIRNRLWREFQTLEWMPEATQDRVWYYDRQPGYSVLPRRHQGPAPRIVVFSQRAVSWSTEGDDLGGEDIEYDPQVDNRRMWLGRVPPRDRQQYAIDLRQEEEESSE